MNVFDLFAKLSLDSSEYDKGIGEAKSKASGIGTTLAKAAKVGAAALGSAATAAGALVKNAVESYADYEQLVGGVETLFKDSADTVQEYAANAYKTAGLSANEYMETVTSFSASLIQATGRGTQQNIEELEATLDEQFKQTKRDLEDQYEAAKKYMTSDQLRQLKRDHQDQLDSLKETNKAMVAEAERMNNTSVTTAESLAEAAELSDRAIRDMSDNANKMGTDMSSIQAAYAGFAKQNYTINNLMSAA